MSQLDELLDELLLVVETAKKLPLTEMVLIDPKNVVDLIQAIKTCLPQEIAAADSLLLDREQIILDAKEQAYREYLEAAAKNEELIKENDLVKEAYAKQAEILKDAKEKAQYYVDSTLEWVDSRFLEMEKLLEKNLEATKAGRAELKRFKIEN